MGGAPLSLCLPLDCCLVDGAADGPGSGGLALGNGMGVDTGGGIGVCVAQMTGHCHQIHTGADHNRGGSVPEQVGVKAGNIVLLPQTAHIAADTVRVEMVVMNKSA